MEYKEKARSLFFDYLEEKLGVEFRESLEVLDDMPMLEFARFIIERYEKKITRLEADASDLSWSINPDRQGGA